MPHLLKRDWQSIKIQGNTWCGLEIKRTVGFLLKPFNGTVPPAAQILAEITAKNLLIALRVGGLLIRGADLPPYILRDYITLSNGNSANLVRLFEMAKGGSPGEKTPSLAEYLEAMKIGKLVAVEPGKPEGGEG